LEFVRRDVDPEAVLTKEVDVSCNGGETIVSLVLWKTNDVKIDGVPEHQTLERVVCGALAAAYPGRAPLVHRWLDSRAMVPAPSSKAHAWSYMAGWYAEQGCEYFYRALWRDSELVAELKTRLEFCGAWRVAEALAS
jgi:hypothetical protein